MGCESDALDCLSARANGRGGLHDGDLLMATTRLHRAANVTHVQHSNDPGLQQIDAYERSIVQTHNDEAAGVALAKFVCDRLRAEYLARQQP